MARYYLNGGDAFRLKLYVEANIGLDNDEVDGSGADPEIGSRDDGAELGTVLDSVVHITSEQQHAKSATALGGGASVQSGKGSGDGWLD